jgi:D-arginine dehydrogenase
VAALLPKPDGTWDVHTAEGRLSCQVVVDAAGAWADEVAALGGVRQLGLQPMRRSAFLSPSRTEYGKISTWPAVTDACERFYFRPFGTELLLSPAEEVPSRAGVPRPDEVAIAEVIERVNAITTLDLRVVRSAWAGLRCFVADRSPVVGSWSDCPGLVFVTAQGGYGIQTAPALAQLGATAVLAVLRGEGPDLIVAGQSLGPDRLRAVLEPW